MKRAVRTIGLSAAFVLVIAACSGDNDAAPTTSAAPTTTLATTTTSAAPTTTTSTTTTTTAAPTTTTEATDAVGDMTETHQAIQDFLELTKQVSSAPPDAVAYLPELDNPDPIVALEEAWNFENWMISVNPDPEWVQFYALPESPYAEETESELLNWIRNSWRVEDFSDTYYFEDAEVVELGNVSMPDDVAADIPASAVAVLFTEGAGPRTVIDRSSGEVLDTWQSFGPDRVLTVLVPTVDGWRLYYSEIGYEA